MTVRSSWNYYTYATPEYFATHGTPKTPQDLKHHNCVIHQINLYEGDKWTFTHKSNLVTIPINGNLKINNSAIALESALSGVGLVRLPRYFFQQHIDRGELVEVLGNYTAPKLTAWLIVPRNEYLSRKHEVFIDFLVNAYQKAGAKTAQNWAVSQKRR